MKFSLTVLSTGAMQGKSIPVTLSEFLIGRSRECSLRPSNPIISKRHCALITRDNKVFVRDFGRTNGTFVNDAEVKVEAELKDGDRLNVGPLAFRVTIEIATQTANQEEGRTKEEQVETTDSAFLPQPSSFSQPVTSHPHTTHHSQ
jgi:pSer/pThr/pTyr-binding forkhead associated (FHA) protein